jgi:hypothetical protein
VVYEWNTSREYWWDDTDRGQPKYSGQKSLPMSLGSPQIPYGLFYEVFDEFLERMMMMYKVLLGQKYIFY